MLTWWWGTGSAGFHVPFEVRIALALVIVSVAAAGGPVQAGPGVELTDDGRTIVYRARPGDTPSAVAEALGVPMPQVEEALAAKGIRDGSRVPVGFEYRVPNPLAGRVDAADARGAELERQLADAEARLAASEHQLAAVQRSEGLRAAQRQRLAQLEGRWWLALWAIVGLSIALAVSGAVAAAALRRERGATRYARTMAHELEEKRRSGLAERQQSARRIIDLEERVRQLEAQLERHDHPVSKSA
jgi:TolA-binding protein